MPTAPATDPTPTQPRSARLRVTVNTPDPAACRQAAREDRDHYSDLYAEPDDHDHAA